MRKVLSLAIGLMLIFASAAFARESRDLLKFRVRAKIPCIRMEDCKEDFIQPGTPRISGLQDLVFRVGDTIPVISFTLQDADTPTNAIVVSALSANAGIFPNRSANVLAGGDGSTRTLTIVPEAGATGRTTFTVTANDGSHTAQGRFTITIQPQNVTQPWIYGLDDITKEVDEPIAPVEFTVVDDTTPPEQLVVTVTGSSDESHLPAPVVQMGSASDKRIVTLSPVPGWVGSAVISFLVTDNNHESSAGTLTVNITHPPDNAPAISAISDITKEAGEAISPVAFTVGDRGAGQTPADELLVTTANSNPELVSSIVIGGSGAARILTLTPASGKTGTAVITVTVTDHEGQKAEDSFAVTISPATSTVPRISAVNDFSVPYATPIGAIWITASDGGHDPTPAAELVLTTESSDANLVSLSSIETGSSPEQRTLNFNLPRGGANGTATITLTVTDKDGEQGTEVFAVTIEPAPSTTPWVDPIADMSKVEGESFDPIVVTVGDGGDDPTPSGELEVMAMSDNLSLLGMPVVSEGATSGQRLLAFTPAAGMTGSAAIIVFVTDSHGETGFWRFRITITPPPTNPAISPVADITKIVGEAIDPETVTVADQGENPTPAADIELMASSSNPALLPHPAVAPGAGDGERIITFAPAPEETGEATVTLMASDANGETGMEQFHVTINPLPWQGPVILNDFADMEIPVDTPIAPIIVRVKDQGEPPTPAGDIDVRGSTTAQGTNILQVDDGTGTLGQTNVFLPTGDPAKPDERTMSLVPDTGVIGNSTVTVAAVDGDGLITEKSFQVRIVAPGNQPPTIEAIADQVINQDAVSPSVQITISDPGTRPCDLTNVKAHSSNQELLPDSAIAIEWYCPSCYSTCVPSIGSTPTTGKYGETTITVTVMDPEFKAASTNYRLKVNAKPVVEALFIGPDPFVINTPPNYNGDGYAYPEGMGTYLPSCDMPKMFFPIRIYDPDNYPSPLSITFPAAYCLDQAQTEARPKSAGLYEIGTVGTGGCAEGGWSGNLSINVSDGLLTTTKSYPVSNYYCPKTAPWVQVPATTLPGGVNVPAFSVLRGPRSMLLNGLDLARSACKYGREYDLITDRQWLAIATLAMGQQDNWTGTGHTISNQQYLTGFGVGVGLPMRGNNDCGVSNFVTAAEVGYDCSGNNLNQLPGTMAGTGADQRLSLIMPNGDFLWSFIGGYPYLVVCDRENPDCINGYVKPGISYSGLPFSATEKLLTDPGVGKSWMLPMAEYRGQVTLGKILENVDATNPRYLVRSSTTATPQYMGLYSLRHINDLANGNYVYPGLRCAGPAVPPNIVHNSRPVIDFIPDVQVEIGDIATVDVTVSDPESPANFLAVRAFRTPDNNLPLTVAGTESPRTLTIPTNIGEAPQARTITVVASDPTGAATTRTFRLNELETVTNICSWSVQPSSLSFVAGIFPTTKDYDYRYLNITNTGTVPIWGGFQTENVPQWITPTVPDTQSTRWCPVAGLNERPFYPGETCSMILYAHDNTVEDVNATMRVKASCGEPKDISMHIQSMCMYYSYPSICKRDPVTSEFLPPPVVNICPEGGCVNDCPQGGCVNYCKGGGCENRCTGGGCENYCEGGGCDNLCIGGNCENTGTHSIITAPASAGPISYSPGVICCCGCAAAWGDEDSDLLESFCERMGGCASSCVPGGLFDGMFCSH